MSVLSSLSRRLDFLGDRVNPIVIKETRQAVRSRAVVSVLSLFIVVLLIGAMAILLFDGNTTRSISEGAGWQTFLTFNSILLVVCGLFIPIYVAIRAAGDRSGVAADLLFTTTIRPASVIWGKLAAGMLVTMLLFATATPFVTVSYLLRGIDLPTIAFWLAFDTLFILLATQVAVFIAVLPTGIVIRVIMGLASMILAFYLIGSMFAAITFFGETSIAQFDSETWLYILSTGGFVLLGIGMIFTLSVACVAPNPSNRAFPPRLYIAVAIVLSYLLTVVVSGQIGYADVIEAWFYGWFIVILIATLVSSGERRDPGMRVLQSRLMRLRILRPIAIVFSSGCFAGLLWCALMSVLLMLGVIIFEPVANALSSSMGMYGWSSSYSVETIMAAVPAIVMAITYSLFAIALRDGPLRRFSKGPVMTPAITMLIIAAVSIFPPIVVAFIDQGNALDSESLSLLNPAASLIWYDSDEQGTRLIIAVVLLLVSLLAVSSGIRKAAAAYRAGWRIPTAPVTEPPVFEQPAPQPQTEADA